MGSRSSRIVLAIFLVVGVLAGAAFYRSYQRSIRIVRVVQVSQQDLHTGVVTNGKAEPISFREVHAELEGEVSELAVQQGDVVKQGQKLIALGPGQVTSELEQARAELAEAESTLRLLQQGGTAAQVDELRAQRDAALRERDQAAKQVQQDERLAEHGAIARVELEQSRLRLTKAEADLALLQEKWDKRSDPNEVARAEARVAAARAALALAESRRRASTIVSPQGGMVYTLAVRVGDHVNRGDLLARVGELDRIRVRVFVDEPDLGRIRQSQPVLITWDGLPGREWAGEVERMPVAVTELGSRMVGEVVCTVDNPGHELLPNTNLNVEIVTERKSGVLAVPRSAALGSGADRYVFLVRNGALLRQAIQTGILSPTLAEVTQGVTAGDSVAIPGEETLQEGMRVRAEGS
jgi:HlyD family secretion protein